MYSSQLLYNQANFSYVILQKNDDYTQSVNHNFCCRHFDFFILKRKYVLTFHVGQANDSYEMSTYSQNKSKCFVHLRQFSAEDSEHPQNYSQTVFWHNKDGPCANKVHVCLFVTQTMRMFTVLILFT